MKTNTYTKWQPMPAIEGWVIIDKIEDSNDGLSIFLHTTKTSKKFKVVFDPYVAYRNMDESYRYKTFLQHGTFESSLHVISNSAWLKWFHEESEGYYKDNDIKHYVIITEADCLDVLSEFEPDVVLLD